MITVKSVLSANVESGSTMLISLVHNDNPLFPTTEKEHLLPAFLKRGKLFVEAVTGRLTLYSV